MVKASDIQWPLVVERREYTSPMRDGLATRVLEVVMTGPHGHVFIRETIRQFDGQVMSQETPELDSHGYCELMDAAILCSMQQWAAFHLCNGNSRPMPRDGGPFGGFGGMIDKALGEMLRASDMIPSEEVEDE